MAKLNELKVDQIATIFGSIVVIQINETTKLVLSENKPIIRGNFPKDVNVKIKIVDRNRLQKALNKVDHQNDWFSLIHGNLIRERYLNKP